MSTQPDRSRARPLAGQTFSQRAKIYVFVTRARSAKRLRVRAKRVRFYIDTTTRGRVRHVDRRSPFDFARAARALRLSTLSATSHTILAAVRMTNRKVQLVRARFTVTRQPAHAASPQLPRPPPPVPAPLPPPGTLRFADEFNGTTLDATKWSAWDSPGNAGIGLRRKSAFTLSGGSLVVTAKMVNGQIVSGGMAHRANYTYGRYEFRVRTERDPTGTLSGVVMTWPHCQRCPEFTENDIYETGPDAARGSFDTFIHYGASHTTQAIHRHHVDATQWHTIVMDWRADSLKIYRDGVLVWNLTDRAAIPDVMHHLGIQLDPFYARTLTTPVRMYVDYVRIYN